MPIWQLLIIFLAIALVLPFILSKFLDTKDLIPITISMIALFFSLIATFKEKIFPAKLEILYGDLIISPADTYSKDDLLLVLPITFVNTGFSEVFIYKMALKIIREESSENKLYIPLFEIDIKKFISGKRRLTIENMDTPFTSFAIPTKQTKMKHIMFSQALKDKKFPTNLWKSGKHKFELYAKTKINENYDLVGQFEWMIDDKLIKAFNTGSSTYLISPTNFKVDN